MKVALFNVKYSPNLGDGAIAECLEHALGRRSGWVAWSIDLAGRTSWGLDGGGRTRAFKLATLQRMPGWLRDVVVGVLLELEVRRRLKRQWRNLLKDADVAVFGGGQLFQDGDLNFPIKVARAADVCRQFKIATAVFAVGATPLRSAMGRRLFDHLLRSPNVRHVAARDEASCALLREFGCEVHLSRDPGLLAAEVWPVPARQAGGPTRVGLGLTHPAVLAHHGTKKADVSKDALSLYLTMTKGLCAAGYDVVCFSNGAAEDELLLAELGSRLHGQERRGSRGGVRFADRCRTPEELARLIAGFDVVLAHRLHAAILAYAYRVPCVGLRWDDKLDRFYCSVGRGHFVIPFDVPNAETIATIVSAALAQPIDPQTHARVVSETMASIDQLATAVEAKTAKLRNQHSSDHQPLAPQSVEAQPWAVASKVTRASLTKERPA